jgi:Domain of unknown function (DUF3291)
VSDDHLAQVNVARLLAPIESPEIAGFVAALDPVNARADRAAGFVWRLQTEAGNATAVHAFDDPLVIVNLSVWESLEALEAFAYGDQGHRAVLRRRREWFERHLESHTALWWIPAGTTPNVTEAVDRLEHLRAHGPTRRAFTFRDRFSAR